MSNKDVKNRQPVSIERVNGVNRRDHIWINVRRLKTFTVISLREAVPVTISKDSVRDYLTRLCAGGYVLRDESVKPFEYTLIKDCGVDSPRLRLDGSVITVGLANENMWRTIKILKGFDWKDVLLVSSTEDMPIKPTTVKSYLEALHRARYITCIRHSNPDGRAVYRFNTKMNTGSRAPMIQRDKSLYDPNLGRVVFKRGDLNDQQ